MISKIIFALTAILVAAALTIPFVSAHDLSLNINASKLFFSGNSTEYKFIVKNLNYSSGQESINISLDYTAYSSDSVEFVKQTNQSLKQQVTVTRRWTPDFGGDYTICGNITYSSSEDENLENNFMCENIFVEGEKKVIEEPEEKIENNTDIIIATAEENHTETITEPEEVKKTIENNDEDEANEEVLLTENKTLTTNAVTANTIAEEKEIISKSQSINRKAIYIFAGLMAFLSVYLILKKAD